jgi:hypothetical protein
MNVDIKTMGRTALTSHMKGKKHLEILKLFQSSSLETFVDIRVSRYCIFKLSSGNQLLWTDRQMNRCTDGWTRVTLYASSWLPHSW